VSLCGIETVSAKAAFDDDFRRRRCKTFASQDYKWGFVSDIAADAIPAGLSEDVVRLISRKKNEPAFMLEWRLKAYRHWLTMKEPEWANVHYQAIDYQKIITTPLPKPTPSTPRASTKSILSCSALTKNLASPAGARVARRRRGGRGL